VIAKLFAPSACGQILTDFFLRAIATQDFAFAHQLLAQGFDPDAHAVLEARLRQEESEL
jgi:hypothetical protein